MSGGVEPVAYDLKSAGAAICMSDAFVRKLVNSGQLPARLVGGKYLVLRRDLEEWVSAQPDAPAHGNWQRRW